MILLESPFVETTRLGAYLSPVIFIALTPSNLVIRPKSSRDESLKCSSPLQNTSSFYPLDAVKLSIFKKSQRQSIKLCQDSCTKYYELGDLEKRKLHWKLWLLHVNELKEEPKIWPFKSFERKDAEEIPIKSLTTLRWTDKYLYLGTLRENEDKDRPKPVSGLGQMEDIKLFYLKPEYFGCWEQSEHWVQCDNPRGYGGVTVIWVGTESYVTYMCDCCTTESGFPRKDIPIRSKCTA